MLKLYRMTFSKNSNVFKRLQIGLILEYKSKVCIQVWGWAFFEYLPSTKFFILKIFPSEETSALSQIRPGNTFRNKSKLLKGNLQHSGIVLGCLTCAWCLTPPLYYTLYTRAKLLPLNLGPQCIVSSLFQIFWQNMEKILFKSCWYSYESLSKYYYGHILK